MLALVVISVVLGLVLGVMGVVKLKAAYDKAHAVVVADLEPIVDVVKEVIDPVVVVPAVPVVVEPVLVADEEEKKV